MTPIIPVIPTEIIHEPSLNEAALEDAVQRAEAAEAEVTELRAALEEWKGYTVVAETALREDRSKWSWDTAVYVGQRLLDELYPADIFTGRSGDLGPAYIVALRNALAALDKKSC